MGSGNITKPSDLRGQTNQEIEFFIRDKSQELLKLKFQKATGQLENITKLKHLRRELARAKTIAAEKARG